MEEDTRWIRGELRIATRYLSWAFHRIFSLATRLSAASSFAAPASPPYNTSGAVLYSWGFQSRQVGCGWKGEIGEGEVFDGSSL
jgi:hypothetical protein